MTIFDLTTMTTRLLILPPQQLTWRLLCVPGSVITDRVTVTHVGYIWIILCIRPAIERRRYIVTSLSIGWVRAQKDPCGPVMPVLPKIQIQFTVPPFFNLHKFLSEYVFHNITKHWNDIIELLQ